MSCLREKINNWLGVVVRGVRQNESSRELYGRNRLGLKIRTRSLPKKIEGTAKPTSTVSE